MKNHVVLLVVIAVWASFMAISTKIVSGIFKPSQVWFVFLLLVVLVLIVLGGG